MAQLHLSRRGGLSCVDNGSPSTTDDRVCFGALGTADLPTTPPSSASASGRATPSSLLVLNLQLAVRLVSTDASVADRVLAAPAVVDELLDASNSCTASPLASSLGAAVFSDAGGASQPTTVADYVLQLLHQVSFDLPFEIDPLERKF